MPRHIRYQGAIVQEDAILLIRHQHHADERTYWVIPGGGIEDGETPEACIAREMKEETNLDVEIGRLLGVYSDPKRDPRFHTASVVFIVKAHGEPKGGDDAKTAKLYALDEIPMEQLVFDHGAILKDYLLQRSTES